MTSVTNSESWLTAKLNSDASSKWILIGPLLLFLLVFMLYPTFYSLYVSFTDYIMRGPPSFVGLENYRYALTDEDFWAALGKFLGGFGAVLGGCWEMC